ncbi:MAG: MerC domain-containing protein [Chthonomonas sp.]|nr:MerC domain-containing protein [Chthonomonas sp.]
MRKHYADPDKIGMIAGTACAIHCVLLGLVASILPFVGLSFLSSTWTDVLFFGIALVVGPMAIFRGIRAHHSWKPAIVFVLGLSLIVGAHTLFGHSHGPVSHPTQAGHIAKVFASVLGGVLLVTFHVWNLRLARAHVCSHACAHMHEVAKKPSTLSH